MKKIIHILGASGSGTTTFGKKIATLKGYYHMDTDDYFWEKTDPPFVLKRDESKRLRMILNDFAKYENIIITGSLCGWGDPLIPYFTTVIELLVPSDVRYKRIQLRELETFGERIMKGGDMYIQHKDFLEWAMNFDKFGLEHRSRVMHDEWLKNLNCPVYKVNADCNVDNLVEKLNSII